ncbi:hypothetical protein NQ317_014629 [Molorchus minor]|uniref:D-isomer specific 2-hydroxyacid dehydrogenase NAD-binding domain-containing protein n=1 Tax=Molorchus minor TaxID=1323400 RepID=A0ABQ9J616_9CUCU|nr:hypothetical protein NQ317_014629 [Molorchus minor]
MSSGYNHIDVDELKKRGVQVGNCPKIADDAVATFAVLLALAASRRYTEARFLMENNRWVSSSNRQWMLGQDLAGSTVGIIGLGGIGQTIVKRLKGFCVGSSCIPDRERKKEAGPLGVKYVSLDHLLRK